MNATTFPDGASIAVIGAGIVGVASALALVDRGFNVTVFDPFPPGLGGPSHRNAGHIGASDIQPLSTPGIASTGLKMMVRKDSPLRIPGFEKIRLIPWFLQFLATSRGKKYEDACHAMTYLCRGAYPALNAMLASIGSAQKVTFEGAGFIYDSLQSYEVSQAGWQLKQAAGLASYPILQGDIARRVPEMNSKFTHGILSTNWGSVTDPLEITQDIADAAKAKGVKFQVVKVDKFAPFSSGVRIFASGYEKVFDGVVVAAGIHSRSFAEALGEKLPLVAERGYNLTFPKPGFKLALPLVMPDRGIAITSLGEGLRIGGWAEYSASPDRPENKSYYTALARISSEIFPRLNKEGSIAWMGSRPSLPDSVPVISKSLNSERVFYNCGHGHYGLSYSAISANILCGQIDGTPIPDPHKAYAIRRFN